MPGPNPVALGLVGHARAGKTTLAAALKDAVPELSVVSFGDAVRDRARTLGLDPTDRAVLIDIGSRWVNEDPEGLCAAVLAQGRSSSLLIDGVRHAHIVDELGRQLKPSRLLLVFLDAPRALLLQRLGTSGIGTTAAEALLSNATEIEVEATLRSRSDLVIDATQTPRHNANILAAALLRATNGSDTRSGTRRGD